MKPKTTSEQSIPRRRHYDVREASKSYSNIASVLAGFAFAAVVLVVQSTLPLNLPNAAILRDLASIAFLLAFFGCIISAFTFSVVAGEEILSPRSHSMAFLGGSGFALSAIYIFWGLVTLTKISLSPMVVGTAYLILGGFILLVPIFLILSWFDVPIAFDEIEKKTIKIPIQTWTVLTTVGYVPILIGGLVRLLAIDGLGVFTTNAYIIVTIISFVLIISGSIWSLLFSNSDHKARISLLGSSIWIGLHSFVFAMLISLLP